MLPNLCSPKREAERRTAHHSCRAAMRGRSRGPIRGPLAFRRSSAVMRRDHSRLGLGRASWNHRMQTGGPSPAPVQRAPRSPARAGRADAQTACRLRATNSARRNRTRSVSRRHRLTSLTMSGMGPLFKSSAALSKAFRFMQTNRRVALSDGRCAQARTRFTPLQRFAKRKLCLSIKAFYAVANLCAAARQRPDCTAAGRFPLVPANAGTQCGFPRAREMSERSPDCAARKPGLTARPAPDFVSLNPGYA